MLKRLATAVLTSLRPKENAPKWGAAAAVVVGSVLANADLDVGEPATAGLGLFLAAVIGKVVQKWFTAPRSDLLDHG